MKRMMLLFVVMFIALFGLYNTNPGKADFREYATAYVADAVKDSMQSSGDFLSSLAALVSGRMAGTAADLAFDRKDYFLFSVYEVKVMGVEYRFLGVLRRFIPISGS